VHLPWEEGLDRGILAQFVVGDMILYVVKNKIVIYNK
jgi:hypothetical protein